MDLARVSRRKAFLVHLAISLAIFAVLLALLVWHWFPGDFFALDGGWQGVRIVAAVDLVLGPMLTLLFFRPARKAHRELSRDLATIAAVQLLALAWGVWTVERQRTVATVFFGTRFYSVAEQALAEANAKLRAAGRPTQVAGALSGHHPALAYVRPVAAEEYGQYLADLFNGLPEAQLRSDRYQPLGPNLERIRAAAVDVEALQVSEPEVGERLRQRLGEARADGRQIGVYLLEARYADALLLLDESDGDRIVGLLKLRDRD